MTLVVSFHVSVVNSISQTAGRSTCNQYVSGITLRQTQAIHLPVVMGQLSTDYFVQEDALNDSIMTQERLSVTGEQSDCSHESLDNENGAGAAGGPRAHEQWFLMHVEMKMWLFLHFISQHSAGENRQLEKYENSRWLHTTGRCSLHLTKNRRGKGTADNLFVCLTPSIFSEIIWCTNESMLTNCTRKGKDVHLQNLI